MKGIVLADGSGSRLHPITKGVSKQLHGRYLLRVIEEKKEDVDSDTFRK